MKRLILLLTLFPLLLQAQQRVIDSLLAQLPSAALDTNKVKLLDMLSFTYSEINPSEGIKYAKQVLSLSEKLEWRKGEASGYSDLGVNYASQSQHALAIENDSKALKIYEELGQKKNMAGVLANMSLVYLGQGDYTKALEVSFRALGIDETNADQANTAIIQENIGIIYMEQQKYNKAMQYLSEALVIHEKRQDASGQARVLGNIGIIEDAKGDYTSALEYYLRALKTNEGNGDKNSIQINLANIGNAYSHLHNYAKALEFHFRALRISEGQRVKKDIAVNNGNIGETYFFIASDTVGNTASDSLVPFGKKANLLLAIAYLEKAKTECREISYFAPLAEFSRFLSEAYALNSDYKKAYETFRAYDAIDDSVFSEQNDLKIKTMETRRELDLKDKEIIIQDKQIEIGKLQSANKRNERMLFISGIVFLLLITAFLIRRFIKRDEEHRNTLSDIASIQSHEIRAPVARILGLAQLFNYENPGDPINEKVIGHIADASVELDKIVKKIVNKTVV